MIAKLIGNKVKKTLFSVGVDLILLGMLVALAWAAWKVLGILLHLFTSVIITAASVLVLAGSVLVLAYIGFQFLLPKED